MEKQSDKKILLTSWSQVREAFRSKDLRQAGYSQGAVVMAGTLLDLHGKAHRERRRVENRLSGAKSSAFGSMKYSREQSQ